MTAIVLALLNDYALANRPAADDAALVERLHALAVHADQGDDAYDSWVELRKELDASSGTLAERPRVAAYPQQAWFHQESEDAEEL